MVDVLHNAFVLHHFTFKSIEENLGQFKGTALYQMIQNELVGIGQEVL